MKPEQLERVKKLLVLDEDPKLAIFNAIEALNGTLKGVIEAVNASKTTEITVANPEDLKISLDPLQGNFDALRASVESVTEAIANEKELDMSGVEKLLRTLVDKPVESVDLSAISSILDDILFAVQTSASHVNDEEENPADKIVPAIEKGDKQLLAILDTINENIVSIEIPNFDYKKMAKIIKDNVSINVSSGGGGNSYVRRISDGEYINPATEESLSQLVMAITNAIDQTAYNLLSAPFSAVTAITNDYILDSIELNFTTSESKTITVTTSDGTILYQDTNINTHVSLTEIDQAFNGGENITVAVTQTAGACSMDCVLKVKQGSNTLLGNPVLGAGTATIGIVDQGVAGTDPWLTVDIVHQRVHEGRYFSGGYYNGAVADTSTIQLLVQTGIETTHAVFQSSATGDSYLQIFEGATFSAAGTAVTMSNHNRSSAKAFVGTVTHTPTVTGTGTQINGTGLIPGGTKSAGSGGEFNGFGSEFLLAPSTVYLVRVTNVAGGAAKMDVHIDCYQPNI